MSKVIVLAKNGINALTATDPNDFVFHSDYNTFKIIDQDIYSPTLGTTASETFTTLAHNQSVIPFVIAFCKFTNNRVGMPGTKASDVDFWFTSFKVDATNMSFGYYNNTGGNYTPVFSYIICEVPL